MIAFDIETGPLPLEQIKRTVKPFDPSTIRHPGEFDPASVAVSHLKDPVKIEAKIEEARKKHVAAVDGHEQAIANAESNHWKEILDRAALNAMTGEVLAIGYKSDKGTKIHCVDSSDVFEQQIFESALLSNFWKQVKAARNNKRQMIGFNIEGFDIPFLMQRSFINGVEIPSFVLNQRYLDSMFVDLMKVWKGPNYRGDFASLDAVCKACGIGGKFEGCSALEFSELFKNPDTQPTALEYLERDLDLTFGLAERLGF